jgi:hypothetical protein
MSKTNESSANSVNSYAESFSRFDEIAARRAQTLVSRLGFRENGATEALRQQQQQPYSGAYEEELDEDEAQKAPELGEQDRVRQVVQAARSTLVGQLQAPGELYDNLNTSSLADDDETTTTSGPVTEPIANGTDRTLPDYERRANAGSFIFANGRFHSLSSAAATRRLQQHDDATIATMQVTPVAIAANTQDYSSSGDELRNYDDDYNSADAMGQPNEDEFFLISTPSPFSLSSRIGANPSSFEFIEQDDLGEEEAATTVEEGDDGEDQQPQHDAHSAAQAMLRYQQQQQLYELNRLSNIIEEEDFNYEDEENHHQQQHPSLRSAYIGTNAPFKAQLAQMDEDSPLNNQSVTFISNLIFF